MLSKCNTLGSKRECHRLAPRSRLTCRPSAMQSPGTPSAEDVKRKMLKEQYEEWKKKFPNVRTVEVGRLASLIQEDREGKGASKLVVVDVRSPEELEVSIIPSRCTLSKDLFERRLEEFKQGDYLVVTYCTAGLRSGTYAEKLLTVHGFKQTNVMNLEGSIIGWTLEGLPVVKQVTTAQGSKMVETRQVHTCTPEWGKYLGPSYEPVGTLSLRSKFGLMADAVGSLLPRT